MGDCLTLLLIFSKNFFIGLYVCLVKQMLFMDPSNIACKLWLNKIYQKMLPLSTTLADILPFITARSDLNWRNSSSMDMWPHIRVWRCCCSVYYMFRSPMLLVYLIVHSGWNIAFHFLDYNVYKNYILPWHCTWYGNCKLRGTWDTDLIEVILIGQSLHAGLADENWTTSANNSMCQG